MAPIYLCRIQSKAVSCALLAEIGDDYKDYDVIGIDEGQFFKDVSAFSCRQAPNLNAN